MMIAVAVWSVHRRAIQARVIIGTDAPARAAITDSAGVFSIRTMPAKELAVSAAKPGYGAVKFRSALISDSTRHVKLSLQPTARKR